MDSKEPMKESTKRLSYREDSAEEFTVTFSPVKAGIYNIYLFGEIVCANQFIGPIEVMNSATEQDVICIHLSTNGGSLSATDTFITAMRECEGHIVCKASGDVHSAGSLILLEADEFSLSQNFSCLLHNGGCGTGGKFSDYKTESQHTIKYMERVMRTSYEGFLSEQEIEDMLRGIDIWLDAPEFAKRHEARNEYLQAKYEALQDEHECGNNCTSCSCKDDEQMSVEEIKEEITGDEAYGTVEFQPLSEAAPRKIRVPKKQQP